MTEEESLHPAEGTFLAEGTERCTSTSARRASSRDGAFERPIAARARSGTVYLLSRMAVRNPPPDEPGTARP